MIRVLTIIALVASLVAFGGSTPAQAGDPMLVYYLTADGSSGRSEVLLDGDIWRETSGSMRITVPYTRMAWVSYIPPMVELTAGEKIEGAAPLMGKRLTFYLTPHHEPRTWELGAEVVGWATSKSGLDDLKRLYSTYKENVNLEWEAQFEERLKGVLEVGKSYKAEFEMEKGGKFLIQLDPGLAPNHVANFVELAKKGFYDGTTFHRVLDGFMAQGGDPTGTGMGDADHNVKAEFGGKHTKGTLSMARAQDPDSASCQFFICFADCAFLDGKYSAFGQVIEGMDTVEAIKRRDPEQRPDFEGDAIKTIRIIEE